LKASKEALASLAAACIKRKINQALLGLREVDLGPNPVFTPKDLQVLVNTFPESGFTQATAGRALPFRPSSPRPDVRVSRHPARLERPGFR